MDIGNVYFHGGYPHSPRSGEHQQTMSNDNNKGSAIVLFLPPSTHTLYFHSLPYTHLSTVSSHRRLCLTAATSSGLRDERVGAIKGRRLSPFIPLPVSVSHCVPPSTTCSLLSPLPPSSCTCVGRVIPPKAGTMVGR